ncbi:glycosyltransferase family 2 protein [Palleronia abyssalis]|uniref:Putative glycosyltransferase n=1 Tax=Palleronia abyssalis TaxID=1501240 RepID=A0A2R8BSE6_9RHOB|nr:glycosyltransferase family 2 protein [Palleronia abyssalis]SPJ23045.1 putative glycosyltransferase [Palleronia abyssalis]
MDKPTISVVTATFNRAHVIGDAMRSVQAQTWPHIEHVIQDGGSTDDTLAVIEATRTPSTRVISEPDTGIYDAINKGIANTTGDIVGLMHSDDFFAAPDVLSDVAHAFEDPAVDGVYGDLDYVAADNTDRIIRRWRSGQFAPSKLRQGWMPPHPTLYLRRRVFDNLGLYDTRFRIAADYDAMLRYLHQGQIKLAYIPKVMVKMRVGGESNRSLSKILKKSSEDYRAIRGNGVGGIGTLARKNLSKITQFF